MDNKNYYELLQIDKNASKDIIDKVYKLLIKKYHPDLQDEEKKNEYEEIIKKINEAYEVLSDEEKRKEYDSSLKQTTISKEDFENLYNENQYLKNELNKAYLYIKQIKNNNQTSNHINNQNNSNISNNFDEQDLYQEYEQKINEAINKAYYDAYIEDLKNRGYKIKYKKTFKNYLKSFIAIIIILIILLIICQIPFVKNHFIKLYNDNKIIRFIINIFL